VSGGKVTGGLCAIGGGGRGLEAATDADRAERIAQSITDEYGKAEALAGVAQALAASSM
jgi:hypothetical protein